MIFSVGKLLHNTLKGPFDKMNSILMQNDEHQWPFHTPQVCGGLTKLTGATGWYFRAFKSCQHVLRSSEHAVLNASVSRSFGPLLLYPKSDKLCIVELKPSLSDPKTIKPLSKDSPEKEFGIARKFAFKTGCISQVATVEVLGICFALLKIDMEVQLCLMQHQLCD